MRVVVVKSPKLFGGLLRRLFGIKKEMLDTEEKAVLQCSTAFSMTKKPSRALMLCSAIVTYLC